MPAASAEEGRIPRRNLLFLGTLVALLLAGTLKVDGLNAALASATLPWDAAAGAQVVLDRLVPVDEIKGAEGLSLQGLLLIVLLGLIGAAAWRCVKRSSSTRTGSIQPCCSAMS